MIEILIANGPFWLQQNIKDRLAENPLTKRYVYNEGYGNDIRYDTEYSYEFRTDPAVIKIFKELYPDGMPDLNEDYTKNWDVILVRCEEVDDERYPYWCVERSIMTGGEYIRIDGLEKHGLK